MKKFFTALTFALAVAVFLLAITCEAYHSVSVTHLKDIIGNWYDTKGNIALTVSNEYKINGCIVLSVDTQAEATAVMYKILINEGNQYRTIELLHIGPYQEYPGHEMLVVDWRNNNGYVLRKTKEPRYFESVGGIYLGMDKDEVLRLYGQPSSVENKVSDSITWKYNNWGLGLDFSWNVVTGITIYKGGDRRFDWSGLSANNTEYEFKRKYTMRESRVRSTWFIGYGAIIHLNKDNVTLSIDW